MYGIDLGKTDACYICLKADHHMRNCHVRLQVEQLIALEKQGTMEVNNVEIED